jgi:hypothetical protein
VGYSPVFGALFSTTHPAASHKHQTYRPPITSISQPELPLTVRYPLHLSIIIIIIIIIFIIIIIIRSIENG